MKNRYVINGRQLCGEMGGVQRYLFEILRELDNIAEYNQIQIAVPKSAENLPVFKNLTYIKIGRLKGIAWEQFSYAFYLFSHRLKGVNLCTAVPLFYPFGINAIHDVMLLRYRQMRKKLKFFYLILLKINYFLAVKFSDKIITVSSDSKNDICNFYNIPEDKIVLCQNSWQQMERIAEEKVSFSFLKEKEFFLALSSNRWQKNFRWIEENAKLYPQNTYIIVGGSDKQQKVENKNVTENVHYLGHLSDGQIKYLYSNCKAFLFPSICEGFGIPPLEALACGSKIVISCTSCLPEIYMNYAYFINPYDCNVNLEKLLEHDVWKPEDLLSRYSWKKSAEELYKLLSD